MEGRVFHSCFDLPSDLTEGIVISTSRHRLFHVGDGISHHVVFEPDRVRLFAVPEEIIQRRPEACRLVDNLVRPGTEVDQRFTAITFLPDNIFRYAYSIQAGVRDTPVLRPILEALQVKEDRVIPDHIHNPPHPHHYGRDAAAHLQASPDFFRACLLFFLLRRFCFRLIRQHVTKHVMYQLIHRTFQRPCRMGVVLTGNPEDADREQHPVFTAPQLHRVRKPRIGALQKTVTETVVNAYRHPVPIQHQERASSPWGVESGRAVPRPPLFQILLPLHGVHLRRHRREFPYRLVVPVQVPVLVHKAEVINNIFQEAVTGKVHKGMIPHAGCGIAGLGLDTLVVKGQDCHKGGQGVFQAYRLVLVAGRMES